MIDEDDGGGGGLGGAAAILGQFGLGGGGGGKYNLDKIVELAKSRRIIQNALLDTIIIEGKKDLLANHLINIYQFQEDWVGDSLLQGFYFTEDTIEETDLAENAVMKSLQGQVIGDAGKGVEGLISVGYGEDTNIFKLTCSSFNEILSISLAKKLYQELSDFYITESIEKPRQTFDLLRVRADSALLALNIAERTLARLGDRSGGILMREERLSQDRLSRNVQILTLMYGEILKNKETSEFLLKTKTPFFQIIDVPVRPIKSNRKSNMKEILIGAFFGGFLGIGLFLGRKVFRDALV